MSKRKSKKSNQPAVSPAAAREAHVPAEGVNQFAEKQALYQTTITAENQRQQRNITQIPLDFYFNRGFISDDQKTAGEKLLENFSNSGIICRSRSMLAPRTDSSAGGGNFAGQAHESYRRAMNAIQGKITQLLIFNVVCIGEWLKDVNHVAVAADEIDYLALPRDCNALTVPIGNRMKRLRQGLGDLVVHYEKVLVKPLMRRTAREISLHDMNGEPV